MPKLNYDYFKKKDDNDDTELDWEKMNRADDERVEELQGQYRSKMAALKEIRDLPPKDLNDKKRTTRDGLLNDVNKIVAEIDAFPKRKRDDDFYFSDGDDAAEKKPGAVRMGQDKKDYRSLFCSDGRSLDKGNFRNASEFIEVVGSGLFDPRLKRASMIEGISSQGGFSVPDEFSAQWLDASLPNEIVRPLCQIWPMTSETRKIPGWDGEDMSAGKLFGGMEMEILAEEGEATKQTGKLRMIVLSAKKGAIFCDISSELEADGLGFENQLTMALQKSIGYGIDKYCLNGTGAGRPQGVFNSSALISVEKESGQDADTIVYQNLTKMYSRQLNKQNAVWLFNDDAVPSLMEITIDVGTGGSQVKLLNEKDGKFTIFGRPVFSTPHMPTIGDAHDCGFIDFGAYALGMRKEMSIDKSIAPGWTKDLVSYRIIIRFDGMGVLSEAVQPENGATLSPFVSLDAR